MAAIDAAPQANSATEQVTETDTPLVELVSDETGQTGKWDLQVAGENLQGSKIVEYSYQYQGKTIFSKKLVVILKSTRPQQYCLGVARIKKKDENELKMLRNKFAPDTAWSFTKVCLEKSEKPQYIHTACRIAIDLRASTTTLLLQSSRFPKTPTPVTTIADILTLKKQQRFDVMAVPTKVLEKRSTRGGVVVADVRLADGSGVGVEQDYACHIVLRERG